MNDFQLIEAYKNGQRDFSGQALGGINLNGAQLTGIDLSGANLNGASLSGANLSGANLSGAILSNASLRRANLRGANLDRTDLTFTDIHGAQMKGAVNLNTAILDKAVTAVVPYDMPYNAVTWAMAHDSHTAGIYHSDYEVNVGGSTDQGQPISGQLAGGIRVFRISSKWNGDEQCVILNHGPYDYGTLTDYLTNVRNFLIANPTEIVTIIDESDNIHSKVASVYDDVFSKNNGVDRFAPGSDPKWPRWPANWQVLTDDKFLWPSLRDLVARNQRLIVFMADDQQPTDPAWMLPAYGHCITTSDSGSPTATPDSRPQFPGEMIDPKRNGGPLYLLNLYFYTISVDFGPAKKIYESDRKLNKWVVGDLIIENTLRAWSVTGKRPNFLNVDFYQGMQLGENVNYLLALVDAMNSDAVETPNDLQEQMVGIRIADQGGLRIGASYTINYANTGWSLARDPDNNIRLRATDQTSSAQLWQVVYQQPNAGFALKNVPPNDGQPAWLRCASPGMPLQADLEGPEGSSDGSFNFLYSSYPSAGNISVGYGIVGLPGSYPQPSDGVSVITTAGYGPNWQLVEVPAQSPPDKVYPVTGMPGFVQQANGQLVVVAPQGGDGFITATFDSLPDDIPTPTIDGKGAAYRGVSLIFSDYGNLELVTLDTNGNLRHWWKNEYAENTTNGSWQDGGLFGSPAYTGLGSHIRCAPALIQSTYKGEGATHGNLEVIVASASNTFRHYYRSSDTMVWESTPDIDVSGGTPSDATVISGIAFLQNAVSGDLEVIVNYLGALQHYYRSGVNGTWLRRPQAVPFLGTAGVLGVPGLVQRKDGSLHLVVALQPDPAQQDGGPDQKVYQKGGGFAHLVYDTSNHSWRVEDSFLPTEGWFDSVCLIDNTVTGNLEILAHRQTQIVGYDLGTLVRYCRNESTGVWGKALTTRGSVFPEQY